MCVHVYIQYIYILLYLLSGSLIRIFPISPEKSATPGTPWSLFERKNHQKMEQSSLDQLCGLIMFDQLLAAHHSILSKAQIGIQLLHIPSIDLHALYLRPWHQVLRHPIGHHLVHRLASQRPIHSGRVGPNVGKAPTCNPGGPAYALKDWFEEFCGIIFCTSDKPS